MMVSVALVLFVLGRYHSPQLAGAAAFLATFPGLLASPVAGALLDRIARPRLITLDYLLVALMLFLVAGLSARHALSPPLLLAICGAASLTGPLSAAGVRSLFPALVPDPMWERANAVDSSTFLVASIVGAPLAGVLVGGAGPEWALAVNGLLFASAGAVILGVRDPAVKREGSRLLADAWSGLTYVFRNRTLVGLALTFFAMSVGWGAVNIAVPVLVLGRLHQGPAAVGYIFGAMGVVGLICTLFVGRVSTRGRERKLMAGSIVVQAAAMAVLAPASSIVVVVAGLAGMTIAEAPFDIAFLTLRQRRTDPARFGRAFAVSMSLNVIGTPIGSALAGWLITWSLNLALWVAVAAVLTGAAMVLTIPKGEPASPGGR